MADKCIRSIDAIITHLLLCGARPGSTTNLSAEEIRHLCMRSKKTVMKEPMLLDIKSPLIICGDIHGYYDELMRIFECGGFPPDARYLFLGDYVDRGTHSIETICLLLAYKIRYPKSFFLLRGNHECGKINYTYGFYDDCINKYNYKVFKAFVDTFNCLPVAAIVDKKIFCCHGGLSPDLKSLEQIRKIKRPSVIPKDGLLCDLLWSDPDSKTVGWKESRRGMGYRFGPDVVNEFLKKHKLALICRAHEVVENGYEFFGDGNLVTVFSVSNYCGTHNNGAIMCVTKNHCTFKVLKDRGES